MNDSVLRVIRLLESIRLETAEYFKESAFFIFSVTGELIEPAYGRA